MTAGRENKEQMNEFKNIPWDRSVGIVTCSGLDAQI